MKALVIISFALVGTGCTTEVRNWYKAGTTQADIASDKAQCQYQAKAAMASYHTTPPPNNQTSGMGTAVGDGVVVAEKQIELTNDCMRAKGYAGS